MRIQASARCGLQLDVVAESAVAGGVTSLKTADELSSAAAEARLQGTDRQVEKSRDLRVGQSLQIAQADDQRQLLSELGQNFVDLL